MNRAELVEIGDPVTAENVGLLPWRTVIVHPAGHVALRTCDRGWVSDIGRSMSEEFIAASEYVVARLPHPTDEPPTCEHGETTAHDTFTIHMWPPPVRPVRCPGPAGRLVPQQEDDEAMKLQAKMLMAMVDSGRVWAVSPEGDPDCMLPVLISVGVAAEICAALAAGRVPVADPGEKP